MKRFTPNSYIFTAQNSKKILARFNGGSISNDGGAILLREVDKKLNLLAQVTNVIPDKRDQKKINHKILVMLR